ncbi:hypothetical protein E2F50_09600 [Rhizobium deserti]|uniref:Uncharacterized protein n=1 Tax=Rhizobium deserti TaxID=2547961 RepID=A0A4R5UJV5_9HYPH|nr:hypothetical protein [Rhizobium deserti]TDK37140.1 hypothetical protein E2F50_09600 [Rhizobium deserti]
MTNEWRFFPHAMTMHDLDAMREALRLAEEQIDAPDPIQGEQLAWIVFRYYRKGLTDPDRLGAMAAFMSSSGLFAPAARTTAA